MGQADRPHESDCRFSQEQYDMLKRCSDKNDMTEWNKWREDNASLDVELDDANLSGMSLNAILLCTGSCFDTPTGLPHTFKGSVYMRRAKMWHTRLNKAHLRGAHLDFALAQDVHLEQACLHECHLRGASLHRAHLKCASLRFADLRDARLWLARLEGTDLTGEVDIQGADFLGACIDQSTFLWKPKVNRYAKGRRVTDLTAVALDNMRIDPGTKQLLEYNVRRKNWEQWYKGHPRCKWGVKPFWWLSDYGLSTGRIIDVFFGLAVAFALVYYLVGLVASPGVVDNLFLDRNAEPIVWWLVPVRALYFSIVTMTTLGFGDMYANAHSILGHILLSFQVILGYVLLGALVTRFAVLFTAGGPAGKFADEKGRIEKIREFMKTRFRRKKEG
jgi:uncharacterized protein YjbI with pentapeptide repeats